MANVLEIDLQLVKVSDWSVCIYPVNALFIVASVGFIVLCTMLILLSKLHFCSSVAALDVVVTVLVILVNIVIGTHSFPAWPSHCE